LLSEIETQTNVDLAGRKEFQRLMNKQDKIKDLENQIDRKDGSSIWIEGNTRAVLDASETLLSYEGIVEDITQQKRLEKELKRQLQE
jgi:PAS domain S-box-containing protein